jgi:ShK domain-like
MTSGLYKQRRIMTSWSLLVGSLFLLLVVMTTCAVAQGNNDEGETCSDQDGTNSCSHHQNNMEICHDKDARCLFWAERGECSNNPNFMKNSCPQSCEFCTGRLEDWEDETCQDMHPKCEEWAESGECVGNPAYMLSACRKSCVTCVNVKLLREEGMDEDEM